MIKLIILDCWNTLFQSSLMNFFKDISEKFSLNITPKILRRFEEIFMLKKYEEYSIPLKIFFKENDISLSEKDFSELKEKLENLELTAFPETLDFLNKAKRIYKLALITNTDFLSIKRLQDKFNINSFFDIQHKSFENGILKPDIILFKRVLEQLDMKKEETIIVGDSLKDDIDIAEEFSIKAILIDRVNKYPNYKRKISSLNEVFNFL